ncbi:MAG: YdcF family protein [Acidobacteriota bacterium]|nr:YdcF family protein [Acidobacteriota bacterium]MDQ3418647.1 YdcF family protein [Acidobacteriota bacterium]
MATRFQRARSIAARLLLVCLVVAVLAGALAFPRLGRFLIIDEPIQPAEALVVLAGARVDRWLEAVDLYREGKGKNILLSPGYLEPAEVRLRANGIDYPAATDLIRNAMVQMGIPANVITSIPEGMDNTAHEALFAARIARERGWKSIVVVTSPYHTRRSLFAFQRELLGTGIDVQVRGTRYDDIDPDRWWKRRHDFRYVTWELQKYIAYRLGVGS